MPTGSDGEPLKCRSVKLNNALEKDVRIDTRDAKQIATDSAAILKPLDELANS
jgi:hypothetical protein